MLKKIIHIALEIFPRAFLIRISYVLRPILILLFRGDKFVDPIDNRSFSRLLPYGYHGKQRQNVLSPSTLSLERHRLLWLYLKRETDFFTKPRRVLHIAPEQAFYKRFRKLSHIDYITLDLESPLADIKADICDMPFEDNSFDMIFCNHVLEHIKDDNKAMKELYRVLKSNGIGILQVPIEIDREVTYEDDSITDYQQRIIAFGQYDHLRVYGKDYFDRLESVGFKTKKIDFLIAFSNEEQEKYAIKNTEAIPLVYKD